MKQVEFIGEKAISKISVLLKSQKPKKIFLVSGNRSFEACGAKSIIESLLKDYPTIKFSEFKTNPQIEDIRRGISLYKKNSCDFVIAVGGGSVIDTAKAIHVLAYQSERPEDYIRNN